MAEDKSNPATESPEGPQKHQQDGQAVDGDSNNTKSAKATAGSKTRSAMLVGIFFNGILFCGIAVIGYLLYEQDKAVDILFEQQNAFSRQRDDSFGDLITRINNQQSSIQELQAELVSARQESADLVAQQGAEIERLQNELVSTRLRINNTNPGASQEWLLAEAASLLRLARQHMVVARSVRTAQALYIAADDVLKQVDDPAVFSVREILAGELAAIRAVTEVDVGSLYLQLGAIADQVSTLQVRNDLEAQVAAGEQMSIGADAGGEEQGFARRIFNRIRDTLNNYFVVRRRDVPIQPLMTPGQEAALMQTIRLQIEQGRTALLNGEQEIYSTSLEKARNNIAEFLSGDEGARNNILETLDSLRSRRIVTEPPPLDRALAALEQILSARGSATGEPAGN